MAKSKEQKWWASLDERERYQLGKYFAMEALVNGNPIEADAPTEIPMHPNEIAALNQVKHIIATEGAEAGIEKAKEIGLDLRHLNS